MVDIRIEDLRVMVIWVWIDKVNWQSNDPANANGSYGDMNVSITWKQAHDEIIAKSSKDNARAFLVIICWVYECKGAKYR